MKNKLLKTYKIITSFVLALLIVVPSFPFIPVAQAVAIPTATVTIGSQTASNGATINVPINASNFSNAVAGMDFSVQYDPTLLTYTGLTQNDISGHGLLTTNSNANTIIINWFDSVALGTDSGTLLTLNFTVISAITTSTNLNFVGTKELSGVSEVISPTSFVNGVISLNPVATLSSIAITTPATKLSYFVGEPLDVTGLVVTGTYSDASAKVETITTANITGFDSSSPIVGQVLTITVGGKTTTYTVNIVAPLSSAKAITNFILSGQVGETIINETTHTISVTVPSIVNITALVPTISITGASVSPSSGVAQDFTNPIVYTVTAADSSTQEYIVWVAVASNTDIVTDKADLVDDSIKGGNPDLSNITVALTNPLPALGSNGSVITWVSNTPTIVSHDGQTISRPAFASGNASVTLMATLTKGVVSDTKSFSLTVLKLPASTVATITSATYTVGADTITNVPFGTSKTDFLTALAKGEANQTWNDTGISNPVVTGNTLVVTAQDGITIATYAVTTALNPAKAIIAFSFDGLGAGAIDEVNHTITATIPFGTNITVLVPTISLSGGTVSPLSGVAQNFTNPIVYTVTAADSSTQVYTVTVTVAPNTAANILSFNSTAPVAVGAISGTNITLTVPFGTSLTDLPIAISLSPGASVLPVDGNTTFVDGVATIYTVTAQDTVTKQDYSVTVNIAANTAKDITSFNFAGLTPSVAGVISGAGITLNVPYGTNITALVSTISLSGGTVSPASGVAQDFTNPVIYTVTAADTTTQAYTATVIVAAPSDLATLTAAIVTAQGKHDIAVEGNLPGQYPAPLKANLQTAINTASAITNASAQSVVDAAVITLNSAITTFEAGIVPPDTTLPVITLIGGDMTIYQGSTYVDAGATALDNIDGNITANIVVVNPVSATSTVGVYIITYNVSDAAGNHAVQVTRTINILPVSNLSQLLSDNTTVSASAPEILVGDNNTASSIITIPDSVTNATINVSALTTSSATSTTATIQGAITINASTTIGAVNVEIPAGIQIVADTSTWNGVINVPQIKENSMVTATPDSGNTATVSSVIEIGFGNTLLSFNKAVRIKIAGQAGKYVGYSRNGVFTPITNVCGADSQVAGDALAAGGDCKISVGSDLIIWTKHFTNFVTYTQTAIPAPSGGRRDSVYIPPAPTPTTIKGDINKDNKVDKYDFALIMANWGKTGTNTSDLNNDGKVDKYDFALLMSKWGL